MKEYPYCVACQHYVAIPFGTANARSCELSEKKIRESHRRVDTHECDHCYLFSLLKFNDNRWSWIR